MKNWLLAALLGLGSFAKAAPMEYWTSSFATFGSISGSSATFTGNGYVVNIPNGSAYIQYDVLASSFMASEVVADGDLAAAGIRAVSNHQVFTAGNNTRSGGFTASKYGNDSSPIYLTFSKTRSTTGTDANTVVANGDRVGAIFTYGADGGSYVNMANIQFEVDGTPGSGDMPGSIKFQTTPDGSATAVTHMNLRNTGALELSAVSGGSSISLDSGTYRNIGVASLAENIYTFTGDANSTGFMFRPRRSDGNSMYGFRIDSNGNVGFNKANLTDVLPTGIEISSRPLILTSAAPSGGFSFIASSSVILGVSQTAAVELYYCNGGTFAGNVCRGSACICTAGTAVPLSIYVK